MKKLLALVLSWQLIFGGLIVLVSPLPAFAATYTAASCSQADVQTAINLTSNGDTVIIPTAGSPCSWSSGITINGKGITITGTGTPNTGGGTTGAGTPLTTLIETGSSPFFKFTGLTPSSSTSIVELLIMSTTNTSVNMNGAVTFSGTCTASSPYCASIRVDNIVFTTGEWEPALDGGMVTIGNVFGVVDHNTSNEATSGSPALVMVNYPSWQGVGDNGNNSFASADTFGTAQAMFIENNSLTGVRGSENDVAPSGLNRGGARYVCRFNSFPNMSGTGMCSAHGTDWNGVMRGQRQVEVEYNTGSSTTGCDALNGLNSGTGYYLSNSFSWPGGGCNNFLDLSIYRLTTDKSTYSPWGVCNAMSITSFSITSNVVTLTGTFSHGDGVQAGDYIIPTGLTVGTYLNGQVLQALSAGLSGTTVEANFTHASVGSTSDSGALGSAYDQSPATTSSQCLDQTGTGPGSLLQNNPPTLVSTGIAGFPNPALDPVYEAGEFMSAGGGGSPAVGVDSSSTGKVVANTNYYQEVSQTAQTSATSPFNGTVGTGYGTLARRPTTCTPHVGYWATDQGTWNTYNSQQGLLYECASTNTWSVLLTPYAYPHPLAGGGSVSVSPGSLACNAVLQGSSGSCGSTTFTNTSGGTITFTTPTFSGTNGSDFSVSSRTCTGTLANGGMCTITVSFNPTGTPVLSETGTLNVNYTGFTGSPVPVSLTGTSGNSTPPVAPTGVGNTVH